MLLKNERVARSTNEAFAMPWAGCFNVARPLVDTWCVNGKIPVLNSDPKTSSDYPWTVDAGWKVTVGDHPHLVLACTFGDGSVTSVVSGVSFGVPLGTENVKVIFKEL